MVSADDMRRRIKESRIVPSVAGCSHDDLHWYAAPADEQGWICDCGWSPGEEPGYSPQHDRELICTKVEGILHDLHEAGIIYVSNGSDGDSISGMVAARCRHEGIYDSVSIARFILKIEANDRHTKFWKDRSDSIVEGRDNRARCHCGKLANCFRGSERLCSAHSSLDDGGPF